MKPLLNILILFTALFSSHSFAQQAMEFDDYTVHYSALNTSLLTPAVAKTYGIRRSGSRALINISVLKNTNGQVPTAVRASVTASGRNLLGQTRSVEMREITEAGDAIYYIGELSVRNMESFQFTVNVTPEGKSRPYELKFKQQFYTE